MFTKKLFAVACAGLLAAGGAQAAASFSQALIPGPNIVSDDNAEIVLKYDASVTGNYRAFNPLTDKIGVNDILVGVVGMTSFPTGALGTSAALYNQISAIYAVQATTAVPYPASPPASLPPGLACGNIVLTTCTYYAFSAATMASATDPLNAALALVNLIYGTTIPIYSNTGANSFAVVLEDDPAVPTPFTRSAASLDAMFNSFEDGTLRMVLDIITTKSDYFFANAPADVKQVPLVPAGAFAGSLGGKSTISYQNIPGWTVGPSVTITGNIQEAGAGPTSIWTDSTYQFNARQTVPEPASLALAGLALAAAGVFGGRRRKA